MSDFHLNGRPIHEPANRCFCTHTNQSLMPFLMHTLTYTPHTYTHTHVNVHRHALQAMMYVRTHTHTQNEQGMSAHAQEKGGMLLKAATDGNLDTLMKLLQVCKTQIYFFIYTRTYVYTSKFMYIYIYIYTCACVCKHTNACVFANTP